MLAYFFGYDLKLLTIIANPESVYLSQASCSSTVTLKPCQTILVLTILPMKARLRLAIRQGILRRNQYCSVKEL